MGSDELGRDIFSRVLWGSRITIPAGLAVIIMGSTLGVIIGAVAGYAGGLVDEVLMRLTELFMAFPFIILAMAVTTALDPDIKNAVLALAAVWWPRFARIIRGLVLEVKAQEYVEQPIASAPAACTSSSALSCLIASPPPSSSPPSISAPPSSPSPPSASSAWDPSLHRPNGDGWSASASTISISGGCGSSRAWRSQAW